MAKFNPFNPNSVVTPSLFAGRNSQVDEILGKLGHVRRSMPASFALHGERGIGKTALAKLIRHKATSKQAPSNEKLSFLSSYYSVENGQTLTSVLQASLNIISDQLNKSTTKKLQDKLGTLFQGGKFTIGAFSVELDKTSTSEKNQILKDQIVSILTNIIKGSNGSDGILIIIDEVHNLSGMNEAAHIMRSIATTLDVNGYGKISFMIIGHSDTMEKLFGPDPSARRHFDSVPLGVMSQEEAIQVLTKGFDEINIKYDKNQIERFINHAGGYPHSIQLLGHNIIAIDTDNNITMEDWKKAIMKTSLDLRKGTFSGFYNFQGKQTLREILMDVLAIVGEPIPKKIAGELCGGKNIYQSTVLGHLKRKGAIKENKENGELRLQSLLLRTAIYFHIILKNKEEDHIMNAKKYLEDMEKKRSSQNSDNF